MERTGRALVTGGTGFLGSRLAECLLARGFEVTVLGRNEAIGRAMVERGMGFLQADLADAPAIRDACRGRDVVFHAGALSSVWGPDEAFHRANVLGTRHIIEGCQEHDVGRLIHVSSPSVLFEFRDRLDLAEDASFPGRAANAYARTKQLAELEIDRAASEGLPVLTFRPRAIFGPGDTAIFPRLIRANRRFFPLFGNPLVDLTYVDNVVDALLLGLEAPAALIGRKYHVTNGEPLPIRELLETVFGRLGVPFAPVRLPRVAGEALATLFEAASLLAGGSPEPVLTRYTVGTLSYSQTLDITAIRRDLGYRPRISVDEGIDRFVRWWKETHG